MESMFTDMTAEEIKSYIIASGYRAIEELIKVAEESIITGDDGDVSADKLKNAAATKKLAIMDAFEILNKLEEEKSNIGFANGSKNKEVTFAEGRARK
jgi:hypothetical protein